VTMKAAPPGWEPHKIMSRVDGWIVDPENEDRVPASVAEMIARALPLTGGGSIDATRARMQARQNMYDQLQKVLRHD
jgi:hypothetical protein